MYRPTRSRTFSTSSGSGETLKLSWSQGLSPNARQISATVSWLMPCFAARPRVDQWVASGGADSQRVDQDRLDHVVADRAGRPGRGASVNPSSRSTAKRWRHLDTVTGLQPNWATISVSVRPSRAGEHDLGSKGERLGRGVPACPSLERLALVGAQGDLDGRSSSTGHGVPPMLAYNTTNDPDGKFPFRHDLSTLQPSGTLGGSPPILQLVCRRPRSVPFGTNTGQAIEPYLRMRSRHIRAAAEALRLGPKGPLTMGDGCPVVGRHVSGGHWLLSDNCVWRARIWSGSRCDVAGHRGTREPSETPFRGNPLGWEARVVLENQVP